MREILVEAVLDSPLFLHEFAFIDGKWYVPFDRLSPISESERELILKSGAVIQVYYEYHQSEFISIHWLIRNSPPGEGRSGFNALLRCFREHYEKLGIGFNRCVFRDKGFAYRYEDLDAKITDEDRQAIEKMFEL